MIIFIPLGSIDKEFINAGYKNPKALINIHGKPLIFYLLDNLDLNNDYKIIIAYNHAYSKHNLQERLINNYPSYNFIFYEINEITYSPCHSIFLCLNNIKLYDEPILFIDCNCFYETDLINKWNYNNSVFYFNNDSDSLLYSYINDSNNKIINIKEKEKISNKSCTGAYGFKSLITFYNTLKILIGNNNYNIYISDVINKLILDKYTFLSINIKIFDWHYLKTPSIAF